MKKILFLLFSVLAVIISCSKTDSIPANFTLEVRGYSEEKLYTFGKEQYVYLWATKSWADNQISNVEYKIDQTVLDEYNKENATSLKMLPKEVFNSNKSVFKVNDETRNAKFKVGVNPEKLIEMGGQYDSLEYALAYRLYNNGVAVENPYGNIVVGIKVLRPEISVTSEAKSSYNVIDIGDYFRISLPLSINFENKKDFDIQVVNNIEMTKQYNKTHGTEYNHIPIDSIEWYEDSITFPKNKENFKLGYYIKSSAIKAGYNILPLKLNNLPEYIQLNSTSDTINYVINHVPKIPQTNWKIVDSSPTQEGSPSNIIDNSLGNFSYWHANWRNKGYVPLPAHITIGLQDSTKLSKVGGVIYYGRQGNTWGNTGAKKAQILVSLDGKEWELAYEFDIKTETRSGWWKPAPYQGAQTFIFPKSFDAKYVKLNITEKIDDGIAVCELYVLGTVE